MKLKTSMTLHAAAIAMLAGTIGGAFLPTLSSSLHAQEFDKELMKESSVIFIGTVTKLNAVSFSEVPVSSNTCVVKIETLLEKPPAVSMQNGELVTLYMKDPAAASVGTKATFYADGWIIGKGVALKEIGHAVMQEVDTLNLRARAAAGFLGSRRQLRDANLEARFSEADVVAFGKIIRVQTPATAQSEKKFISEHDPEWREAVLKVQNGMKGVADGEEIVVRFPGSMDVAFHTMPKLREGEERVIFLKKDSISGMQRAMYAGMEVEAYVAEKSTDVMSKENLPAIQKLMKPR